MTGSYISLGLDFKSKPLVSTDRAKVSDIEIVLTRKEQEFEEKEQSYF